MRHKKIDIEAISDEKIPVKNTIKNNSHIVQPMKPTSDQKKPVEVSPIQEVKPNSTDSGSKNEGDALNKLAKNPALSIKSGATDLRRGVKQLGEITKNRMGQDPLDGNMHAFANKPKTTIKIVQEKKDGTTLIVKYLKKPAEWPKYQPSDKPGHIVVLTGKEKDDQLKKLGFPQKL
jgi:hypothetical protein